MPVQARPAVAAAAPAAHDPGPSVEDVGEELPRSRTRLWHAIIAGLAAVALLATCGLGSWMIVEDERSGATPDPDEVNAAPTVMPRDISSREVDPAPLTEKEVFPTKEIKINQAEPAYQILKTQASADCQIAAAGEIAKLLKEMGCSQVVRGTMRSPTEAYLVTAGVFNLADEEAANWVRDQVKPLVDADKGRLQGMPAGTGTEPVARASAHVGWDVRGHFVIYSVIARADGKEITADDPYAEQILYDMLLLHLRDKILEERAMVKVSPSAAGG